MKKRTMIDLSRGKIDDLLPQLETALDCLYSDSEEAFTDEEIEQIGDTVRATRKLLDELVHGFSRRCPRCDSSFRTRRSEGKWCSPKCRSAANTENSRDRKRNAEQ